MNKLIGRFTDDVASVAILNLFLDHEIPANGALDLQLLEREWRRTGLRHDDLVDGLQQVTNAGLARLSHGEEDRCVILTESGYRRCNGLADSPAGYRNQLTALTVLLRVSRRRRSDMPGFGRRVTDPPTAKADSTALGLH